MFKNYFRGIEGIADYPLVLLIMFFLFFVVIGCWLYYADKKTLAELSNLPFPEEEHADSGGDERKPKG